MTYWWVNQNQTHEFEIEGGFLWSPRLIRNGRRNQFYENMRLVSEGDMIFSYYNSLIQYLGTARGKATAANKPANFGEPGQWDRDGWHVPVEWHPLARPLSPKEIISEIAPYLPPKYSPLQKTGNGLQGVYLARLPDAMAKILMDNISA